MLQNLDILTNENAQCHYNCYELELILAINVSL